MKPLAIWIAGLSSLLAAARLAPAPVPPAIQTDRTYRSDFFGTDLGLPQPSALAVLQTRDGYLWVGTQGGLGRFDGVRFTPFVRGTVPALVSDSVRCLMEDSAGTLWIGTEAGLVAEKAGKFTRSPPLTGTVTALAETADHTLWIGTTGQGLFSLRAGVLRHQSDPALVSDYIETLFVDSADRLWVGFYGSGLARLEHGAYQPVRIVKSGSVTVRAMAEFPRGRMWIGTRGRGLYREDRPGVWTDFRPADGIAGSSVVGIKPASDGTLWIVSAALQHVVNPEHPRFDTVFAIRDGILTSLADDSEGSLWLCARDDGLIRVRPLRYRTVGVADGLPADAVRAVTGDPAGNIWVSMGSGAPLSRVAPDGTVTRLESAQEASADPTGMVYGSRDGSVWVGAAELQRRRGGEVVERFRDYNHVRAMFEDRDGDLWLAAPSQGLVRYRAGKFELMEPKPEHPMPLATSFSQSPDGTIAMGFWENGLAEWKNGQFVFSTRANSGLPSDEIRTLAFDRRGRLWVGLRGVGLAVREDGRWSSSPALAQAVASQVSAIAEDSQGQLWLGTPGGVMWAPPERLLALAEGRSTDTHLHAVGQGKGAPPAPVTAGVYPTVWPTAEGNLLFATRRGVLIVDPLNTPTNELPPPVRIERMLVDQSEVPITGRVVIAPGKHALSFDYTALSFVQPSSVFFQYRLEGYDSEWTDAGPRRVATYIHLPPGKYTFRVKACNEDGVWNETGAALPFTLEPLPWERPWFRFALLGLFALAVALIVRLISFRRLRARLEKLGRQAALDQERTRIARDIHDDVGNRMTEITLLSELALRARASGGAGGADEAVRQISDRARQVTDSLDEIVWAVSPRNDTLPHLIGYLGQFAVDFLRKAGIECQLVLPDHPPELPLSAEVRHNLFLAVKEALTNVVRHAHARRVQLGVAATAESLTVTIQDDGVGLSADARQNGGNGLGNMRTRLEQVGGQIRFETPAAGTGTLITLAVFHL